MISATLALMLLAAANSANPGIENAGFEAAPFLAGWTTRVRTKRENGRAPGFAADRNNPKEGE